MKFSIRIKLLLLSILLTSACFLSWLVSYQFIRISKETLSEIKNLKLKNVLMTQAADAEFETYVSNVVVAISTKEIQVLEENRIRIDNIEKVLRDLQSRDPSYKEYSSFSDTLDEVHQTSRLFLQQITGTKSKQEITHLLDDNSRKIQSIKNSLKQLRQKADEDFDLTTEKMNHDTNQFAMIGTAIMGLLIGFVILSSIFILGSLIARINRLKTHFSNTGIDSLEPVADTWNDELGDLLKVSNTMLMNIKESRSELIEKHFVENIINTINDMLIVCDSEWKILRTNLRAQIFFAEEKNSIYKEDIFKLLHPVDSDEHHSLEFMKKTLSETGFLNSDAILRTETKEDVFIHMSAAAMSNTSKNSANSYVFIIRDISHQIANEREKLTLQAQLAQSAKLASLGTLGAGVAHELNNPLTAVMAYAELIQRSKELPEKIKDFAITILRCSDRMKSIIDKLRNFSLDTSNLQYEALSIQECIKEVQIFLQYRLNLMDIEVHMDFCKENDIILGDKNQIESIFLNFFSNSCDSFAELSDSRKKEIYIKSTCTSDSISILFKDNARGIPSSKLKNVFDPFFTTKTVGSGTGLGLFIVHQIITNHKGSIDVTSIEGHGTEFTLNFPLPTSLVPKVEEPDLSPILKKFSNQKRSLLVIDDEIFILNLFEELLSEIFDVQIENDPSKVYDIVKEKRFDLIICDAKMPKLNGTKILKGLRKDLKIDTPIIIMTGHAQSEQEIDKVLKEGANMVMNKPLPRRAELIEIIENIIASSSVEKVHT